MTEMEDLRARLETINTKAYYLLVALTFLYYKTGASAARSLKVALILTTFFAATPVQDYVMSCSVLKFIQALKVTCLWFAFLATTWWVVAGFLR